MRYYVAEISFFEGNPRSRYIVRSLGKTRYKLFGPENIDIIIKKDTHYFKIIKEIGLEEI